jgi:WD40 repeat protein
VGEPFRGHTVDVNAVAFLPDGRHIASGSDNQIIRIWDAKTGKTVVGPLQGHSSYIMSIQFLSDGKCIFSGNFDHSIMVWDSDIDSANGFL